MIATLQISCVSCQSQDRGKRWSLHHVKMFADYTCNSCSVSVKILKGYVQHQGLQRNKAHYLYAGCKSRFRNYNTLNLSCLPSSSAVIFCVTVRVSAGTLQCEVTNCQRQLIDLSDLLGNLKFHISEREQVHCPFKNCDRSFSVKSSFTSHLSRKHKYSTASHVFTVFLQFVVSQFSVAERHSDEGADDDGVRRIY